MPTASHRYSFAFLAALLACAPSALAQKADWPVRPIRYVVPFPPAGATDILARFVAEKVSPMLGQTVVVENRAGAAGAVGTEFVVKSASDGYTILMATAAQAISETLYTKQPFSFARDLAPVAQVARVPNVMVVHPSLPVKNVKDFIALAKSRPGQINFASSGPGTTLHMSGEMFKLMTGVDIVHVPYKGSAPALTDLIAGHVSVMWDNLPAAMPHIKSARLRPIAITTAARYAGMPELPTVAESGVPGFEASAWFGVMAPAATSKDVITRLNTAINRAVALPDMRERFEQQGAIPVSATPEEFGAFIRAEIAKWAKVVKASGAKVD
ncbi:MAG: tripartite tricarboxylate transporter substrate binding protein [Betaproteobacteria bacterium]|nr:tripartite tricarboxylate transporter substrate binding protein [Betaproteobacteria bacterium]